MISVVIGCICFVFVGGVFGFFLGVIVGNDAQQKSTEKLSPMTSQDALTALCDYFLGEKYYIADPVSSSQANAIIVDDIMRNYKPKKKIKKGN